MYGGLTISYAYFGLHGGSASFTLRCSRINCIYLINLVIKFNNLENSHCFLFRGQVQMPLPGSAHRQHMCEDQAAR